MANDAMVSAVGTVMADPQSRQINNSTVVNFRLAVQTTMQKEGEKYPVSNFYEVAVWGKAGEYLLSTVQKGTVLWVNGDMMLAEYVDRNGQTRQQLRLNAQRFKVVAKGKKANTSNNSDEDNTIPF